jgi:hypothetical protein
MNIKNAYPQISQINTDFKKTRGVEPHPTKMVV